MRERCEASVRRQLMATILVWYIYIIYTNIDTWAFFGSNGSNQDKVDLKLNYAELVLVDAR